MRASRGWLAASAVVISIAVLGNVSGKEEAAETPGRTTVSADAGAVNPTFPPTTIAPPAAATRQPTPEITEAPLGSAPHGDVEEAEVVRVVDGDTIVIDRGFGNERVRYIGVDTPETVDPNSPVEWMGPEASAANKALVEGRTVLLERDVSETDPYGRLLRYVWIEDASSPSGLLLVNLALVASGYAQVVTYPPDVRYVDLYLDAQERARDGEFGLWGPAPTAKPTPRPTPKPTLKPTPKPTPKPTKKPSRTCHTSYEGACLRADASDYDCEGGSGNGPYYTGTVYVVGPDVFDLDRDNDGVGCE